MCNARVCTSNVSLFCLTGTERNNWSSWGHGKYECASDHYLNHDGHWSQGYIGDPGPDGPVGLPGMRGLSGLKVSETSYDVLCLLILKKRVLMLTKWCLIVMISIPLGSAGFSGSTWTCWTHGWNGMCRGYFMLLQIYYHTYILSQGTKGEKVSACDLYEHSRKQTVYMHKTSWPCAHSFVHVHFKSYDFVL